MHSSVEEAYNAVERAYGQGDFKAALQQAEALQPQIPAGRQDLLDQRLQLLIGHIQLYGIGQPEQAEAAYSAVLQQCQEASYRALAEHGLQHCAHLRQHLAQQAAAAAPVEPAPTEPEPAANAPAAVAETAPVTAESPAADGSLPATPWLQQLQDPQQALAEIQQAWSTVIPAAPAPVMTVAAPVPDGSAATPWTPSDPAAPEAPAAAQAATEPTREPDQEAASDPEPEPAPAPIAAADPEPEPEPEPAPEPEPEPLFSPEQLAELEQGLRLISLSGGAAAMTAVESVTTDSPTASPQTPERWGLLRRLRRR